MSTIGEQVIENPERRPVARMRNATTCVDFDVTDGLVTVEIGEMGAERGIAFSVPIARWQRATEALAIEYRSQWSRARTEELFAK